MKVIDYYINLNSIVYIDYIKEKEMENEDQVSKNDRKKEWW